MVYRKGESPVLTVLDELCTTLGLCIKRDKSNEFVAKNAENLPLSAKDIDELTRAVFVAERLDLSRGWDEARALVARRLSPASEKQVLMHLT